VLGAQWRPWPLFPETRSASLPELAGIAGLRGEGWIPVPLPPPAWPKPCILCANLLAIWPRSSSDFSLELRTYNRQSRLILLRKAHFSPKLWTLRIRHGSRNSNVSRGLRILTKRGSAAPLGQARATDFEFAISRFESSAPKAKSVTHVSGTEYHLCLASLTGVRETSRDNDRKACQWAGLLQSGGQSPKPPNFADGRTNSPKVSGYDGDNSRFWGDAGDRV
jgi:hypothetical protein